MNNKPKGNSRRDEEERERPLPGFKISTGRGSRENNAWYTQVERRGGLRGEGGEETARRGRGSAVVGGRVTELGNRKMKTQSREEGGDAVGGKVAWG